MSAVLAQVSNKTKVNLGNNQHLIMSPPNQLVLQFSSLEGQSEVKQDKICPKSHTG